MGESVFDASVKEELIRRQLASEFLRFETRELHEWLESLLPLERLVGSRESYIAVLRTWEEVLQCLEPELMRTDLISDGRERRKLPLVHTDLLALGELPKKRDCSAPKELVQGSDSFRLGALYVLEGSTLGGQIISRHVRERLGLDFSNGAAFYRSYGPAIGPMWRSFIGTLNRKCTDKANINEAVKGAQLTFRFIGARFLEPNPLA